MSAVRPPKSVPVDLVAVRRCDRAFDALAARRVARCDDPALRLLAALVRDVDDGLPANGATFGKPNEPNAPDWDATPVPGEVGYGRRRRGRRVGARAALAAGVAVAALTTTGVAAAKIGTFEAAGRALGISESTESTSPAPSDVAADRVVADLHTARAQMDRGHLTAAQRSIRQAWQHWADVRGHRSAALAGEIENLEARLADEAGRRGVPGELAPGPGAPIPGPGATEVAIPQSSDHPGPMKGETQGEAKQKKDKPESGAAGDVTGASTGEPTASSDVEGSTTHGPRGDYTEPSPSPSPTASGETTSSGAEETPTASDTEDGGDEGLGDQGASKPQGEGYPKHHQKAALRSISIL